MKEKESFLRMLDEVIGQNKMLNHPFYQTWSEGKLSRHALREYAKQYYHFVQAFPTLVSATHANTPDLPTRQVLLENLIEEERGPGNHPGLWNQFASALGIGAEEARSAPLLPETEEALRTLKSLTHSGSYLEGVAALYAYESQIPEVAKVKIQGLKEFYGVTEEKALAFFAVHKEADVYHSGDEKTILAEKALSESERQSCLEAARKASGAMLRLLDGVQRAYVAPSMN